LDGIFLRPLSPFGLRLKTKQFQKYDAGKWLDFYERGSAPRAGHQPAKASHSESMPR